MSTKKRAAIQFVQSPVPDFVFQRDVLGQTKSKRLSVFKRLRYKNLAAPELNVTYINLTIRAAAKFIDIAIVFGIVMVIESVLFGFDFKNKEYNSFRIIIGFTVWILYNGLLEGSVYQATIGKMMFHIKVIDIYGNRLSMFIAHLRCVCTLFSILPMGLGIWYIASDSRKQGWHDLLAGTYVIKDIRMV